MTEGEAGSIRTGNMSGLMRSLRFRFHILLLVLALPILGIIVFMGVQERNQIVEDQAVRARLIADQILDDQDWLISRTQRHLTELSILPAVRSAANPECSNALREKHPLGSDYSNVVVLDARGEVRCFARPLVSGLDIRVYPGVRQTLINGQFSVGFAERGALSGGPTIVLSAPILLVGSGSSERGAIVATVPVSAWLHALTERILPDDTMFILSDRDGQIVSRHPDLPGQGGDAKTDKMPDDGSRTYIDLPLFNDGQNYLLRMTLGVVNLVTVGTATKRALLHLALIVAAYAAIWLTMTRQLEALVFRPLDEMEDEIDRLSNLRTQDSGEQPREEFGPGRMAEFDRLSEGIRSLSSARDRAQEAEQQRADQILAILEALPDTYFRLDAGGTILDFKAGSPGDLYLPPAAFLGKRVDDILPEDICDGFRESVEQQKRTQKPYLWEYVLTIGGEPRNFQAFTHRIESRDETVVVVRDITDRKRAERGYQTVETRLHSIVSNLPGTVVNIEINDRSLSERSISYISAGSRALWGYEPAEMLADPEIITRLHDPEDLPRMRQAMYHCAHTLTPQTRRFAIHDRAGRRKEVEAHMNAARIDSTLVQITIFLADVTEMIETQKQLERQKEVTFFAQKHEIIGQLTGGVAHDFNNLLAVVMGNQELLRDELTDPEQIKLVDASLQATERGADLTRSMLAFARKARLEPVVIDLNELVTQIRGWSGRTFPANIEIETRAQAGLWKIEADPGSTESALLNLIVNARDAMPDGGRLTIETANIDSLPDGAVIPGVDREPGRYVMLSVADTGMGIPADRLETVFEPFYTTKPPGAGSGLGLSMVQGFMLQSGGTVQVTSELGRGTCFRLFFKAVAARGQTVSTTSESAVVQATAHQRILVAEDKKEVLAVLDTILTRAGYQVTPVSTGDAAFTAFEANPTYDLLLTDIMMPGRLQGMELARFLRQLKPDLPVIFISGYSSEEEITNDAKFDGDVRLMKPITRATLLAAIRKALGEG